MPDTAGRIGGGSIDLVEYAVEIRRQGQTDPIGEGADDAAADIRVRRFELREALDRPYVLSIDLYVEGILLVPDELLRADLQLSMVRGEIERVVHGVVQTAYYHGTFDDKQHFELTVVPALALLQLEHRSHIYQDQSVLQLVDELTKPVFEAHDRPAVSRQLGGEYEARDYCVQLAETTFDFVQRILSEAGIAYTFDHVEQAEQLVLLDQNDMFRPVGVGFAGGAGDEQTILPVITSGAPELADTEAVTTFEVVLRPVPARYEVRDWAFKPSPALRFEASAEGEADRLRFGEWYEHDQRRVYEADRGDGAQRDDTTPRLATLSESIDARGFTGHGFSNVVAMAPGHTFELDGHPQAELDRSYLVTEVIHRADCPEVERQAGTSGGANYVNEFACIPLDTPYRPRKLPKPTTQGPQTAIVTGPAGEEIHTDEYGRIKVRMHWDRSDTDDDLSSCWLRVAQTWAGPGWGTMFIPRVGMEVIVSFIGGDPDKPIVTGCVYNGTNAPPYALPDEKTKSTIKTSSSPGGDGFNELRFEDAKGSEEVFLHAQRDLQEVIERNQSTSVGANESLSVGANQTIDVKGNRSVTVKGAETITIEGEAVGKTPPPPVGRALTIAKGDHTITVTEGAMTVSAAKMLTLTVGGTSIVLTPQAITFAAADGATADFGAGINMSSAKAAAEMLMDESGKMSLSNEKTKLEMDKNVVLERGANNALQLDGAAKLSSDGKAKVELTEDALMGGANVECKAAGAFVKLGGGTGEMRCMASVDIVAAPSRLELGPAGAKVASAAMTSVDGMQVKVAGMLVSIN